MFLEKLAHQPHFQASCDGSVGWYWTDPDVVVKEKSLRHWAVAVAAGHAGRGVWQAPNRGAAGRSQVHGYDFTVSFCRRVSHPAKAVLSGETMIPMHSHRAEDRPPKLPARLAVGLGLGSDPSGGFPPLCAPSWSLLRFSRRLVPPRHHSGRSNDFGCAVIHAWATNFVKFRDWNPPTARSFRPSLPRLSAARLQRSVSHLGRCRCPLLVCHKRDGWG